VSPISLPDPIAAYFAADTKGAEDVARCFTPAGVVKDQGLTHTGREAISAWKAETSTLYTYTNAPYAIESIDGVHVVSSHVAGSFPGSPIVMKLRFRLERGLIAALEFSV
jgi:hypothetical protein